MNQAYGYRKERDMKMKNTEILLEALNEVSDEFIPRQGANRADINDYIDDGGEYCAEMEIVTPKRISVKKRVFFGGACAAVLAGSLVLNGIYRASINEDLGYNEVMANSRIYSENKWETKTDDLPLITSDYRGVGYYIPYTAGDIRAMEKTNSWIEYGRWKQCPFSAI